MHTHLEQNQQINHLAYRFFVDEEGTATKTLLGLNMRFASLSIFSERGMRCAVDGTRLPYHGAEPQAKVEQPGTS